MQKVASKFSVLNTMIINPQKVVVEMCPKNMDAPTWNT